MLISSRTRSPALSSPSDERYRARRAERDRIEDQRRAREAQWRDSIENRVGRVFELAAMTSRVRVDGRPLVAEIRLREHGTEIELLAAAELLRSAGGTLAGRMYATAASVSTPLISSAPTVRPSRQRLLTPRPSCSDVARPTRPNRSSTGRSRYGSKSYSAVRHERRPRPTHRHTACAARVDCQR
jgi:hypothetical protein